MVIYGDSKLIQIKYKEGIDFVDGIVKGHKNLYNDVRGNAGENIE